MASISGHGSLERAQAALSKPKRPNYHLLHAQPLPLKVYPLPTLIPHNPFSVLRLVFSYISQLLFPPSSHPTKPYVGYFSEATRSVHITDEIAIRALWESGFFGKGSLSRSEPSWLDREKKRLGMVVGETSEEVIRKRKQERKEFKRERARKEREFIEETLRKERSNSANGHIQILSSSGESGREQVPTTAAADMSPKSVPTPEDTQPKSSLANDKGINNASAENVQDALSATARAQIDDQEHLQLTLEEAFFLSYGLGVLDIYSESTQVPITTTSFLTLCRQNSYFPPQPTSTLKPDDPFLLSYVVYHHFRSLGWVVRSGVKFAVDYLLYNRGPVFSHAEFAVVIIPAYSDAYWREGDLGEEVRGKETSKAWYWLQAVNRVQSQVRKRLVLIYVEVPPPQEGDHGIIDITEMFKRYKVREFAISRWTPNTNRD
jgi:tRNA-splicing endonuclease subunit Sen2